MCYNLYKILLQVKLIFMKKESEQWLPQVGLREWGRGWPARVMGELSVVIITFYILGRILRYLGPFIIYTQWSIKMLPKGIKKLKFT